MHVALTDLTQTDIELVRQWRNSPDVSRFMYTDQHITPEQQQSWFENVKNDPTRKYWMVTCADKKVGVASLMDIRAQFGSCYWAFYLGDPSTTGGGIGSKIEFQVLDYVFDTLKLNKLRCEVFVFNAKVIQLHEKFGFRREAYYRQHIKKNGKYEDVVGLAVLRSEWLAIRDALRPIVYRERVL